MYRVLVPASCPCCSPAAAWRAPLAHGRLCRLRPADQLARPEPHTRSAETASAHPERDADSAASVARADDKIPKGTFEKAPTGALVGPRLRQHPARRRAGARAHQRLPQGEGPEAPEAQRGADRGGQGAFARPRQVGPHLALRLGRLQSLGPREARRLQRQARGRERRHRPGHHRRGDEGLAGEPRPQQEPAAGRRRAHGHRPGAGPKTEFKTFWTLVVGSSLIPCDFGQNLKFMLLEPFRLSWKHIRRL